MCSKRIGFILLLTLLYSAVKISAKFEFTNVECKSLDKSFDDFEYCHLKSFNRSYKYLSLKVKLFKTPIMKVKVRAILFKRYNGYKPFMFNITVDACRFLKNTKSHPAALYFFEFLKSYSNMNHTCPFDHDLILEKLEVGFVNHQATKVLPFPEGDYQLETHWIAYDIDRAPRKYMAPSPDRLAITKLVNFVGMCK